MERLNSCLRKKRTTTMASSQVEIAPSSPFGCVLRDHNRRDGFRDSKWRKFTVNDRLKAFISITSDENENSWLPNTLRIPGNGNAGVGFSPAMSPRGTPSAAAEILEREAREEALPSPDCPAETPNHLGAASLVQMWEKRLKRSDSATNPDSPALSCKESAVSCVEEERDSGSGQSLETEDSVLDEERFDWQSDRTAPPSEQPSPCCSRGSDAGESERVRVADIIKRLTGPQSGESERESGGSPSAAAAADQPEQQRILSQPVVISRRIRGRQAFADLLMQMERERHGELNTLVERRPVSRFPQKGRIQSMLRLRSLERGMAVQDRHRLRSTSSSSSSSSSCQAERLPQQGSSSITHLRERFSTKVEHVVTPRSGDADNLRSPHGEIAIIAKAENLETNTDEQRQNHEKRFTTRAENVVTSRSDNADDDRSAQMTSIAKAGNSENSPTSKTGERLSTNVEEDVTSRSRDSDDPRSARGEITRIAKAENLENRSITQEQRRNHDESREIFGTKVELVVTSRSVAKPEKLENSSTSNTDEQRQNHEAISVQQQDTTVGHDLSAHISEEFHKELGPVTSVTCQETSSEDKSLAPQETSLVDRNLDSQESVKNAEATTSYDCWGVNTDADELEENYLQYEEETGYDWISDISRPRSYWEDRRQEWYYEMLDSNSKNAEIRQLLQRGTVSGFLASEFRERMDRLMTTRLEIQTHSTSSQVGEEDEQSHLLCLLQQKSQETQQQLQQQQQEPKEEMEDGEEEEEHEEERQEEQEEESLINGQFHETSDYFDQSTSSMQIPSPSLLRTWSFRDNEAGDDSDRSPSTSPRQENFPSQSYYHNEQQCSSSVNHPSIEMELICELRGQMEQIYHEMSDLRKSLKSCMDMQMILMQQSMKQDVHSEDVKNKSPCDGAVPKKGNCCICYEMKVDALLYRCGHMCTCLKCAHELQWSSGKCPICCAAIVDVVRAYLDS